MSVWFPKREKDGRWSYIQVPVFVVWLGMSVLAFLVMVAVLVIKEFIANP